MKKRTFEIPADSMADFAEVLAESNLENEICGKNENDDIIVKVYYDAEDKEQIFELVEWYEENIDSEDEDDD